MPMVAVFPSNATHSWDLAYFNELTSIKRSFLAESRDARASAVGHSKHTINRTARSDVLANSICSRRALSQREAEPRPTTAVHSRFAPRTWRSCRVAAHGARP